MANNTSLYGSNGNVLPAGDNVIITGTLTVNGCAILTDCSAFNLLPFNANTLNIGLESTTLALGSTSGVTTVRNQLATSNYAFPVSDGTANQVLITDGSGVLSFANVGSLDTNYTIQADTATGGANLTLVGSDATTDSVKFANGTNVTVSRTDANTITISSVDTNTTYTQNASTATGGANLNLVGSDATTDTIKFADGTGMSVVRTDANTITFNNTATAGTTYTINSSSTLGGANLNLVGSDATTDTITYTGTTGVTISSPDANTIDIAIGQPVAPSDTVSFNALSVTGTSFTTDVGVSVTLNQQNIQIGDSTSAAQGFSIAGNIGHGAFLYFDPAIDTFYFTSQTDGDLLTLGPAAATFAKPIKLDGSTSGSSQFSAPATGSTLTYVLPGVAGAADTFLKNDGSGNLTWDVPGSAGATFGNITVAIVTDNTISTTTGNLVLASATNNIDASTTTITAGAYTVGTSGTIDNQATTTTSVAPVPIQSTTRNGMKVVVSIVDNVTTARHMVEALLFRQGGNAYVTTYAEIYSSAALATFSADDSGGALRLIATPASTNSTTFETIRMSIN